MRRKIALSIAAATGAAMLVGGIAYAQSGPSHGMPMGDMTRADVETHTARAFERMDANDDGVLNAADREARQEARFDRLDTDSNGSISRDEFTAARGGGHQGGEHRMGRRGHRGHGGPGMMAKMADTNGDGAISQAEFTAAALARFETADANNDGTVTAAERQAARQKMREAHKAADAG